MATVATPNTCPQCGYFVRNTPPPISLDRSRIDQLLGTNDTLEEVEQRNLRSCVNDGQSKLTNINTRIAMVKALLLTLEASKEKLEVAVTEGKHILHPMRGIPTELLQKVFYFGAGLDIDAMEHLSFAPHSLDLSSPPWVYGRVSRRWRAISRDTPMLWTRVKIEGDNIIPTKRMRNQAFARIPIPSQNFGLSLLSSYLSRSGTFPLSVYVNVGLDFASGISNYTDGISALVASHSHRWESLFLGKGNNQGRIETRSLSEHSFPSFIHLRVQENACSGTEIYLPASNLTSWSTLGDPEYSNPLGLLPEILIVPPSTSLCNQITQCSISKISHTEVLRMVQLLPRLQRLSIQDLREVLEVLGLAEPVNTGLKEIFIEQSTETALSIRAILDSITCPSLVKFYATTRRSLAASFGQLENRSKFNLRSLDITGWTGIFSILNRTKAVEVLVVRGIGDSGNASVLFGNHALCVRDLHSFFSYGFFNRGIAASRFDPFPNLRQLEIHMSPELDLKDIDVVAELIAFVTFRLSHAPPSGSNFAIQPLEISIKLQEIDARRMFTHPCIDKLRALTRKLHILVL
ncbi:hypothetical protein BT96DRAFT_1023509 [Gymnopus androsaceus JB14]|uniref:Uncharacterized protein n=1 Tax=Gymnopus androsaceus JB14 TaxID=1447944 RepID=A0A6A4H619_9AGAR|nr:hypothetical protein BT96DRAFT_1023509 [Gymnopus androsaceus JB14]